MPASRREFLAASAGVAAASAGSLSLLGAPLAAPGPAAKRPLRILILGGTGFLGPACVEAALGRGHQLTLFNSGRSEERRKQAGRPSLVPAGVETLYGNRDPNKSAADRRAEAAPNATPGATAPAATAPVAAAALDPNSPKGLSQLVGKKWDAVIDTSGYFPRLVRASAELLSSAVKQYVYISSISVYKDVSRPGTDEAAPLFGLADPKVEEFGKEFENYGGGKALSEQAAEAAMPGRVTVVRPGFIVGPRDTSARFIYWPVRAALGGTMAVPGSPSDPIQVIDVRDLAEWLVHCIENKIVGRFNATGPAKELPMSEMVDAVRRGVSGEAAPVFIANDFLTTQGIGDEQFPLYTPPTGKLGGIHRCSIAKALAAGLKFRPLSDTAKVTLDWYRSLPADIAAKVAPQFAPPKSGEPWLEREKRLVAAWETQRPFKPKMG